jgi:hypothetical protein
MTIKRRGGFRFVTGFIRHSQFLIKIHYIWGITNSHSLQFTTHVPSILGLFSFTSLLVPASNGRRSPYWVPNCPHATATSILDSQCTHWNSFGTSSSCHWLCHPIICLLSAVLSCNVEAEVEVDFATDGQPTISSWCRALLWDPWPGFKLSTILTINCFFM